MSERRDPAVWTVIVTMSAETLATLEATAFRPVPIRAGGSEIRTPGRRAFALLQVGPEVGGLRELLVPVARRAFRSEQAVEESVYPYLRLGLARLPDLEPDERPTELRRLLKNAYIHVAGADIGRPRRQLKAMRGRVVRGGLPSLGKRR